MSKRNVSSKDFILLASILIGGIVVSLFTLFFIDNQYNATAEFNVHTEESVDPGIYEAIIKSDKVVTKLKEQENITLPVQKLKEKITVTYNEDSDTLKVSLFLDNRRDSILITESLAQIATEEIETFVQGSTVEYVTAPDDGVVEDKSHKVKLIYVIVGLIIGYFVGTLIDTFQKPRVGKRKSAESDYTVLGSIPKY